LDASDGPEPEVTAKNAQDKLTANFRLAYLLIQCTVDTARTIIRRVEPTDEESAASVSTPMTMNSCDNNECRSNGLGETPNNNASYRYISSSAHLKLPGSSHHPPVPPLVMRVCLPH